MQKLQTVNAETLLYEPLEKPSFVVDSLIPTGLSLFCGFLLSDVVYDNDRQRVPVGKVFDEGDVPIVACIGIVF